MRFLRRLILQILTAILTIWLADQFISGVEFKGGWEKLFLIGIFLGLANFFLRPFLNFITLPLRILTLGLFGLVVGMFLIWLVDYFFAELYIFGLRAIFLTTLLFWFLNRLIR